MGKPSTNMTTFPDEIMRTVGTNWLKRYATLSDDDDPAFVAACVYRVMRWAKRNPDALSLAHLREGRNA